MEIQFVHGLYLLLKYLHFCKILLHNFIKTMYIYGKINSASRYKIDIKFARRDAERKASLFYTMRL